jgi:hypothetical protein
VSRPRTYRDVIEAAFKHQNVRYGTDLERIAKRAGFPLVSTTINQMKAGTYHSRPERPTLEALAFISGLPMRVIQEVAGVPVTETPFVDQLPADVDRLTPRERDAVIVLLRVLLDRPAGGAEPVNPLLTAGASEAGKGGAPHSRDVPTTTGPSVDNDEATGY